AASGSSARTPGAAHPRAAAPMSTSTAFTRLAVSGRSMLVWLLRMIRPSVREPEQQVPRVVIGSTASETVVVAAGAVELVVGGVLRGDLDVEPGGVVHLRHPAARVG